MCRLLVVYSMYMLLVVHSYSCSGSDIHNGHNVQYWCMHHGSTDYILRCNSMSSDFDTGSCCCTNNTPAQRLSVLH